jgi:SAM-dependent methyltransferase
MYAFPNSESVAGDRLSALSDVFDRSTAERLLDCGIGAGWRCLEVGAGSGSIAVWMAQRVAPGGSVVATDLDPRHVVNEVASHLEIRQHDIERDPLPADAFDLIHARLVLSHLSDPDRAMDRMVSALRPGGWIVLEDFEMLESESETMFSQLPATARAMRRMTADAMDMRMGRSLWRRLSVRGLENIETEGVARVYRGATPAATLLRLTFGQLRSRLLSAGLLTEAELDADLARLDDPDFEMRAPIMWAAWGRRGTA